MPERKTNNPLNIYIKAFRMETLSADDEIIILKYRDKLPAAARIKLTYTDTAVGKKMTAFCDRLRELIPAASVHRGAADEEDPAIHVSDNIHFLAVPSGKLLESFMFALLGNEALANQKLKPGSAEIQQRVTLPAMLKMYVAINCPYCSQALPRALFLAGAAPSKIDLRVIDAGLFEQGAKSDRIRSVPVMILDDRFRWTGIFNPSEVIDVIAGRDPSQLSSDTLKKMISDGDAEGVARLMHESNTVIPGYIDLAVHERMAVRLGAMVVFEYLAETNTALSRKIMDLLWERFSGAGDTVKGDILHLCGMLEDPGQVDRLETIVSGSYPETVKQVAREVIDGIKK